MAQKNPCSPVQVLILDSDVLITFLRNNPRAIALIDGVPLAKRTISVVSYLEVLCECQNRRQLNEWRQFVSWGLAEVIPLTESISRSAQHLMEQYILARRLSLGDVLIAATALTRNEPLATGNRKHFDFIPGLELKVFRP